MKRFYAIVGLLFAAMVLASCSKVEQEEPKPPVPIPVTGVALDRTELALSPREKWLIKASVYPSKATNKAVQWSTSDPKVVTVSQNGEVTAVASGKAVITVTTEDGAKTKSCSILVMSNGMMFYLAGCEMTDTTGVATYWKIRETDKFNFGVPLVTDQRIKYSSASAIFVDLQENIYTAGYQDQDKGRVAVYWKNGEIHKLTDGEGSAEASAICATRGTVLVAGNDGSVAMVWEDGKATALTAGENNAVATSVFVAGDSVYVGGHQKGDDGLYHAKYWICKLERVATTLAEGGSRMAVNWASRKQVVLNSEATESKVSSIFVVDGSVYMAGSCDGAAAYWKDGVLTKLTAGQSDALGRSIYVEEQDVYVAGYEVENDLKEAKYWKNGVPVALGRGTEGSDVYSIFVLQGKVFMSGIIGHFATFWKNGEQIQLYQGRQNTAYAMSVFVQE